MARFDHQQPKPQTAAPRCSCGFQQANQASQTQQQLTSAAARNAAQPTVLGGVSVWGLQVLLLVVVIVIPVLRGVPV